MVDGKNLKKDKAIFFDRDGVINIDHGYVGQKDRFEFVPNCADFMREARLWGYRLVVVTNQSGIARQKYTETDYLDLTDWYSNQLAEQGALLDLVEFCPFHHEAVSDDYKRKASCFYKPDIGMILRAEQILSLDLSRSILIGDSAKDMEAAKNAGIPQRWMFHGGGTGEETPLATRSIANYQQALSYLKEFVTQGA